MQLRELKSWFSENNTQIVLFHQQSGRIIDSCHTFLNVGHLLGASAYEKFPLLGSMQHVLVSLQPEDALIEIPAVHHDSRTPEKYFDYYFVPHLNESDVIMWFLKDQTLMYLKLREIQQERNELRFRLEYLNQHKP